MKHKRYFFVFLTCLLIVPVIYVSFNVLSVFVQSYPVKSTYQSKDWRRTFFLTHYKHHDTNLLSLYDPAASKELAYFLLGESFNDAVSLEKQKKLRYSAYTILISLQKYYPHDSILILRKALWLRQKKQFVQAYAALDQSYSVAPCYEPAMRYRIMLKDLFNLVIPHKINHDIKSLKDNQCSMIPISKDVRHG